MKTRAAGVLGLDPLTFMTLHVGLVTLSLPLLGVEGAILGATCPTVGTPRENGRGERESERDSLGPAEAA